MTVKEACNILKVLDPMDTGSVYNGLGLVCYAKANGWPIDAEKLEAYETIKNVFWERFEKKWKEAA